MDLDPSILPSIPERKGSLYLRSNHMRYTSGTLNSNWHVDREAEPKDYDIHGIAGNKKKDLQRSTYQQIGNMHEGPHETTTTTASKEVFDLKEDYNPRIQRKQMFDADNFDLSTTVRETGTPGCGYGCILPHHTPTHGLRYLESTQRRDYLYPYTWKPGTAKQTHNDVGAHFHRKQSQFTDTADYRHKGFNQWQDHR